MRINLTKKESHLLSLLVEHKNSLLDNYTIENELWPFKESNPNTIRTLISRLKKKLDYNLIKTIPSRGYILYIN